MLTNQPLNEIFENRDAAPRISKWALKLSQYVVDFERRSAIKSQVLADFIADWTESNRYGTEPMQDEYWTIHCDGAWGLQGVGIATVIMSPSRIKLRYAARLEFIRHTDKCINNIAEYEAVLLALKKLRALGIRRCKIKTDSKVVANQIDKNYIAREPQLKKYLLIVRGQEKYFKGFTIEFSERGKIAKPMNWRR